MNLPAAIIATAARLVTRARRAEYREAWMADLRDCGSLGMSPSAIAAGALRTAVSVDNLRSVALQHAANGKELVMQLIPRSDAVRLALTAAWTLAAALLLYIAGNHLVQSGSNLGFTFPNGSSVELLPIAIVVATASVLVGVSYGGTVLRRVRIRA